jgi:hypothetical protein
LATELAKAQVSASDGHGFVEQSDRWAATPAT